MFIPGDWGVPENFGERRKIQGSTEEFRRAPESCRGAPEDLEGCRGVTGERRSLRGERRSATRKRRQLQESAGRRKKALERCRKSRSSTGKQRRSTRLRRRISGCEVEREQCNGENQGFAGRSRIAPRCGRTVRRPSGTVPPFPRTLPPDFEESRRGDEVSPRVDGSHRSLRPFHPASPHIAPHRVSEVSARHGIRLARMGASHRAAACNDWHT